MIVNCFVYFLICRVHKKHQSGAKIIDAGEDMRDKETRQLGREGVRGPTGRNQCFDTNVEIIMTPTKHKRKPVFNKKMKLFFF